MAIFSCDTEPVPVGITKERIRGRGMEGMEGRKRHDQRKQMRAGLSTIRFPGIHLEFSHNP